MKQKKVCTQCGACLAECPIFALYQSEEYSPKAKQTLMYKAWDDSGEFTWEKMVDLAGHCTSCERCKTACARRLSVPDALADVRARNPRWQQYFWKEWISNGKLLWPMASTMAPLVPNSLLPTKLAIMHAAALAMKAPKKIEPWLKLVEKHAPEVEKQKYVIFSGCTATRLRPAWEEKTKKYITTLGGHITEAQEFNCCGGTFHHAGMNETAHKAATHNVQVWKKLGMPKIVVFCISCLHSLKHYTTMPGILNEHDAKHWNEALSPLSAVLKHGQFEKTAQAPQQFAYHSPCHWGGKDEDAIFLSNVLPGMKKGTAKCCGFGGVLKMFNPELSEKLSQVCWDGLMPNDKQQDVAVLTGCSGCTMQLNAHAPQQGQAYHWLDCIH